MQILEADLLLLLQQELVCLKPFPMEVSVSS